MLLTFTVPAGCETPIVDGKLSIESYINAVQGSFADYAHKIMLNESEILERLDNIIFHTPFPKMAERAYFALCKNLNYANSERHFEKK